MIPRALRKDGLRATEVLSDFRGARAGVGRVRLSTPIVARPETSSIVSVPSAAPWAGWNWKIRTKTPDQTITCKTVQAMSDVNIVSNDGRSQVSSAASRHEPAATFSPLRGVTSS